MRCALARGLVRSPVPDRVLRTDPALGKAVINKCFAEYGDEDMVKECVGEFAMFLPRYQSAGTPH